MAIIFIDEEIRCELACSMRFSRDLYTRPSNILLVHPNGVDYIALKNRLYFNSQKKISPSDINEYEVLDERELFSNVTFQDIMNLHFLNGRNIIINENFLNDNGQRILKEMLEAKKMKVAIRFADLVFEQYENFRFKLIKSRLSNKGGFYSANEVQFAFNSFSYRVVIVNALGEIISDNNVQGKAFVVEQFNVLNCGMSNEQEQLSKIFNR